MAIATGNAFLTFELNNLYANRESKGRVLLPFKFKIYLKGSYKFLGLFGKLMLLISFSIKNDNSLILLIFYLIYQLNSFHSRF